MATIGDVVKQYGCSRQTARTWASETADYLSAGANPPAGQTRRFTDEDMRVLAVVAEMKADRHNYAAIRARLAQGLPEPAPDEAPLTHGVPTAEVEKLRSELAQLHAQLEKADAENAWLREELEKAHLARVVAERTAGEYFGRYRETRAIVQHLLPSGPQAGRSQPAADFDIEEIPRRPSDTAATPEVTAAADEAPQTIDVGPKRLPPTFGGEDEVLRASDQLRRELEEQWRKSEKDAERGGWWRRRR